MRFARRAGGKSKGKKRKAKGKNEEGTPLILHFCLLDFCLLPFAFLTSAKAWESANSSVFQETN